MATLPGPASKTARRARRSLRIKRLLGILAWVLAVCVVVQVLLAGAAVFVSEAWWQSHRSFVHLFELLPILMLVLSFLGPVPGSLRWMTAGVFVLMALQYVFVAVKPGFPAALHAVNALAIFWLAVEIARRALAGSGAPAPAPAA